MTDFCMMRRLAVTLLSLVAIFLPLRSENDTEQYRVRGILADGTEIEGYNKTSMQNFMRPWVTEVKLADANGDSERKYSSDELKVAQAEIPVHMLNWGKWNVKISGV